MVLRRSLIALALSLLASMAAHPLDKDSLDPACGFVFTGAAAQRLAGTLVRAEDLGGTWDPSSAEIRELESALAQELSRRLSAPSVGAYPRASIRDYYRQYAGINLKGEKLIVINGFFRSHVDYTTAWLAQPHSEAELAAFPAEARGKTYWHFVPVVVLDGGEHYFEAYYDPVHHRISGFEFHGYG